MYPNPNKPHQNSSNFELFDLDWFQASKKNHNKTFISLYQCDNGVVGLRECWPIVGKKFYGSICVDAPPIMDMYRLE